MPIDRPHLNGANFRKAASVVLLSGLLAACAPAENKASKGPSSTEPNIEVMTTQPGDTFDTFVLTKNGRLKFFQNIRQFQNPYIGIEDMYLTIHPTLPVIGVFCFMDQNTKATQLEPNKIPGALGFQELTLGFIPDYSHLDNSIDPKVMSKNDLDSYMFSQVNRIKALNLSRGLLLTNALMRPPLDQNNTILFRAGLTTMGKQPSPDSYLRMSFIFQELNPQSPQNKTSA